VQHYVWDLKQQKRGSIVEISLVSACNVWLMNSSTYSRYRRGRGGRAIGGYYKRSPVRLQIPSSGHWYVTMDLGGHSGKVGGSVTVLPGLAAPGRSLQAIADNAIAGDDFAEEREFDVFVSHATEDKADVVRPLAAALEQRGLAVWFDETELRVGRSLRRTIDAGISRSRFGIVVVSRSFFAKNWPQYELDGLVTREMHGSEQIILPLWHDITKDEVVRASPSLADKVALRTADLTIDEIAAEIARVVQPNDDAKAA
jgi:hypothetical protein